MDDCDCAANYAEFFLSLSKKKQLKQRADMGEIESREICIDCGEDIPVARQKAVLGCQRCIACQAKFETAERC